MSKSDVAQEAAHHLRELAVRLGGRSEYLLGTVAQEYEIEPNVVRAWLLRDFESLDALDAWAAVRREEKRRLPELMRKHIENLQQDLGREWKDIETTVAAWLKEMRDSDRKKNA